MLSGRGGDTLTHLPVHPDRETKAHGAEATQEQFEYRSLLRLHSQERVTLGGRDSDGT